MRRYFWRVLLGAVLVYSVLAAGQVRQEARRLTDELSGLRDNARRLEDERRSLSLEYFARADFSKVRAAATRGGMLEPSLADGSLLYLSATAPSPKQ